MSIPRTSRLLAALAVCTALVCVVVSAPDAWAEDPPKGGQPKPPPQPAPKAPPKAEPKPAPKAEPEEPKPPLDFLDQGLIERANGKVVYFYRTNFVRPKDLKSSLVSLLGLQESVITLNEFDRQNVLLFEGFPEDVDMWLEAAAYFDVATPQVFIEAKVVEITYDSNFEFGINYLWSREKVGPPTLFQGANAILSPTSYISSQLPGGLPFQGTSLLFGFVGEKAEKFGLLDATIQALQMDGKAEVLSKPSIICTQGLEATVSTTEDRQIVQFQNADRNNERYQAFPLQTGVTLKVKAEHIGENFVTLKIDPMVKGVQGTSVTGSATLRPITTTRQASTTVTMADKETLVIGGLYTHTRVNSKAKTPLLSDIPVLGCLFTRTQEAKAKSELVFMLTPTIVRKTTADLRVIVPPSELERLEEKDEDCWRPAGPTLGLGCSGCDCNTRSKAESPAPATPATRSSTPCHPRSSADLPPPVTSSPSTFPRHQR